MVSSRLSVLRTSGSVLAAGALLLTAACTRDRSPGSTAEGDPVGAAAQQVSDEYRAGDITASGAWTWEGPGGVIFVLVDAQSALEGIVQGRADLWAVTDSGPSPVGQSDVMPSAAEIGAYAFEDLTGDGFPDLFGWVADSAGVSYPIFLVGARGRLREEVAIAASGWRFTAEQDGAEVPRAVRGVNQACALQLWVEDSAPDGRPAGWRYLAIGTDGHLGAPAAESPVCP